MSTPTPILELCDRASPGPWHAQGIVPIDDTGPGTPLRIHLDQPYDKYVVRREWRDEQNRRCSTYVAQIASRHMKADAELIARLSPEVVRKVVWALEWANRELYLAGSVPVTEAMKSNPMTEALRLLNGQTGD